MKIKGVIEDLKRKKINDNSKNISRNFSGAVVGSVGQFSFSSVIQLILLKIYRPLPM